MTSSKWNYIHKHHKTTISSQDQWFRNSETHRKHVFHSFHGNISLAQTGPSETAWQSVSAATLLLEPQLIFWVSGRGATWEERGRPPSSRVGPVWPVTEGVAKVPSESRDPRRDVVSELKIKVCLGSVVFSLLWIMRRCHKKQPVLITVFIQFDVCYQ